MKTKYVEKVEGRIKSRRQTSLGGICDATESC